LWISIDYEDPPKNRRLLGDMKIKEKNKI